MTVIIGSARGDERGKASGGAAGDQKQTKIPDYSGEVSMQEWYAHSKGWVLLRAIDPEVRERIAQDMIFACENKLIGYDQSENKTLYEVAKPVGFDCSKVTKKCETDCARLVRVCVLYAGVECEDFYTENLPEKLMKTGKFKKYTAAKYTKSDKNLIRGDILCTQTKGHVVVVCYTDAEPETGIKAVRKFQAFLNDTEDYREIIRKTTGDDLLEEDGEYGPKTRAASLGVWKHMANKYYGWSLTIGNDNFLQMCRLAAISMTDAEIRKHPTLAWILQGILAGKGYDTDPDGKLTEKTKEAVKAFQAAAGIRASGEMDADTWYKLFN